MMKSATLYWLQGCPQSTLAGASPHYFVKKEKKKQKKKQRKKTKQKNKKQKTTKK